MTTLATVPIDGNPGTTALGPWTLANSDTTLTFTFANWSETFTVALAVDITLNAAVTWLPLGKLNPSPGGAPNPRGPLAISFLPLPLLCQCGVYYLPGVAAYDRALSHSTVVLKPGVTLQQIGQVVPYPVVSTAAFLTRILVDRNGIDLDNRFVDRTFHVPSPGVNPARQVRATLTIAGGHIVSTLTVSSA